MTVERVPDIFGGSMKVGQVVFNGERNVVDVLTNHYTHVGTWGGLKYMYNNTREVVGNWNSNGVRITNVHCTNINEINTKAQGVTFDIISGNTILKSIVHHEEFSLGNITTLLAKAISEEGQKEQELTAVREKGRAVTLSEVRFEDIVEDIEVSGGTIQEKYMSIVGNLSELTRSINQNYALGNHKELAETFHKAKEELKALATEAPSKVGFIGKWLGDTRLYKAVSTDVKKAMTQTQSTQDNIDYLFGLIYTKYEDFVSMGENLQKAKGQMDKQIEALKEILKSSNANLKRYKIKSNIPIRMLVLNTQIKTSIEKYKQRIIKIDGAIVATQTTIMALAKDLPAMKTDLTEEMAIGALLNSVDDYQKMYEEVADVVRQATDITAKRTHMVVENLLDMQIKDTHTIEYLKSASARSEKFTEMFLEKTTKLTAKIHNDAEQVTKLAVKALPTSARNFLN